MVHVFLVDGLRTPIGRYGGALAPVRPDDLAALVLREILDRHPEFRAGDVDEVVLGCANQAGEDNRNVARMALLLAGLPETVPGVTVNRLCGSGLDALAYAARTIRSGEADLVLAGGVESMSRAPFVLPKAQMPYDRRQATVYDTTIGWRFVNAALQAVYGTDSMPETAENVATDYGVSRADQDAFALRSQERAAKAAASGRFREEIVPVPVPRRSGDAMVETDEHPRETSLEALAALRPVVKDDGTVTAGNASGINDGAAALLVMSERAVAQYGVTPLARIVGFATAGVAPRVMGIGPVPATTRLLGRTGVSLDDVDVVEINEAFAAQTLACLRLLGLPDDAEHVNPNGGAIALGHPLGMSGARIALTAGLEARHRDARYALATMCIGVGQGIAALLERP